MLLATLVVSFILTVIGIPAFIRFYQRAHISGQQMHEDVKQHKAKAGTPTMGGVVFLITSVFVTLVFSFLTGNFTRPVQLILFILVLYGIVGFLDDFLKVFRKINEGLNIGSVRSPLTPVTEDDRPVVEAAAALIRETKERFL